ncbi:hypothetical protein BpHYR1_044835 [Brachionus plicatilis]|uniref:Uncharacterized protein n=1 Tax=Brachionus plicatilis TaxID=10195 RepID=A0A3M7RB01_BRAPC|nr:hypothetical protein BpHYR1_044835 [Brachionus plicatilis]
MRKKKPRIYCAIASLIPMHFFGHKYHKLVWNKVTRKKNIIVIIYHLKTLKTHYLDSHLSRSSAFTISSPNVIIFMAIEVSIEGLSMFK